jgi:hypothetical protein
MGWVNENLIFIIAHKYVRGYPSYLKYYIDNIKTFYPKSLIIVVDNNSKNIKDITDQFDDVYDNLIFLENNTDCKFEIGAYRVGLDHINQMGSDLDYSYIVCTQDTYILKKKYDFNILKTNNVYVAPLIGWKNDLSKMDVIKSILTDLGLFNRLDETNLCWCNSFVLSKDKVTEFYNYIKDIVITVRSQSEGSERYLGRLFLELNNGINFSIDGEVNTFISNGIMYDCHSINGYADIDKYFCKISQQKNERTIE